MGSGRPAAPEGLGSSVRRRRRRRRGWRGGSWFLASLMPGLTITSGNISRHGSHQGGPISATAGARLEQSPSLGSGAGWWEQNVPGRTRGMGRAAAVPPAPCASPAAAGSSSSPGVPRGVWGHSSCAVGRPVPVAGLAVLPLRPHRLPSVPVLGSLCHGGGGSPGLCWGCLRGFSQF